MKKLFYILTFIIYSNSFSQDCEYIKNEKDEFTGDIVKSTKYKSIYEDIDLDIYRKKYFEFKEPKKLKKKQKKKFLKQKNEYFLEFVDKKLESKIGVFKVSAINVNNNYFIKFYITRKDIFSISKGNELMLKLKNEKIIKLKNSELKIASFKKSGKYTIWKEVFDFKVSSEEYKSLVNSPLKKVRIYLDKGYIEKDIIEKHKNNLIESLKCIE